MMTWYDMAQPNTITQTTNNCNEINRDLIRIRKDITYMYEQRDNPDSEGNSVKTRLFL